MFFPHSVSYTKVRNRVDLELGRKYYLKTTEAEAFAAHDCTFLAVALRVQASSLWVLLNL